jgi:uncharacterized protein YukE
VSDEIAIDVPALRTQAGHIDQAAGSVDYALDAVRSMNLSGGAFGLMCSFLVSPAMLVTSIAASTMAETAAMLRREAEALRDIAADFERVEAEVGADLRSLSAEIG